VDGWWSRGGATRVGGQTDKSIINNAALEKPPFLAFQWISVYDFCLSQFYKSLSLLSFIPYLYFCFFRLPLQSFCPVLITDYSKLIALAIIA
jgi:hypothetical protein